MLAGKQEASRRLTLVHSEVTSWVQAQAQKQKMSAKAQKKFAKRQAYGSSLPVNGLSSTLAFTPIQVSLTFAHPLVTCVLKWSCPMEYKSDAKRLSVQGIELQNPTAHLQQQDADMRSGTESYFSEYSGFRSIKQKPPPPTFG